MGCEEWRSRSGDLKGSDNTMEGGKESPRVLAILATGLDYSREAAPA